MAVLGLVALPADLLVVAVPLSPSLPGCRNAPVWTQLEGRERSQFEQLLDAVEDVAGYLERIAAALEKTPEAEKGRKAGGDG